MAAARTGRISTGCSGRRHRIDTSERHAPGMTASLFVTGTPVAWTGRDRRDAEVSGPDPVHAVAKPVVDGLDSSVCGLLVTASAGRDWSVDPGAARCAECARIADDVGGVAR